MHFFTQVIEAFYSAFFKRQLCQNLCISLGAFEDHKRFVNKNIWTVATKTAKKCVTTHLLNESAMKTVDARTLSLYRIAGTRLDQKQCEQKKYRVA